MKENEKLSDLTLGELALFSKDFDWVRRVVDIEDDTSVDFTVAIQAMRMGYQIYFVQGEKDKGQTIQFFDSSSRDAIPFNEIDTGRWYIDKKL